jgi:hypothetical protein
MMKKILFVFCMLMGAGANACTQIGKDFNGNAIFDCAGVIVNTGGSQKRDPYLEIMRKHRLDQEEQRKFNERMRSYERTKPRKIELVDRVIVK